MAHRNNKDDEIARDAAWSSGDVAGSRGLVAEGHAPTDWHCRTPAEVAATLGTDLAQGSQLDRMQRVWIALRPTSKRQALVGRRCGFCGTSSKGGVIVVLLVATALSWLMGHRGDAIGIGASVVFSVFFGFLTDFRAETGLGGALKT